MLENNPKMTDLSSYNNSWYNPGPIHHRIAWYIVNFIFFQNSLFPFSSLKRMLLRIFGAKIGEGVVIKPKVNIKYPWLLEIGEFSWIGEGVWIDNLAKVHIGKNVCLSQNAILLCGSHNYRKSTFDLEIDSIILEDGVWIGAEAIVAKGTICKSHSIVSLKSVAKGVLKEYGIYSGNPAVLIKKREIVE